MDNTLEKWRNRWNIEGVRILVLTSLSIQIGLFFLASMRKRSGNKVLALMIWLFYLTAELVPTLALGNMGNQIDPEEIGDSGTIPGDLTVLWAPFLLIHLGGPDNITSYTIDDNELWWRQPLALVIQVVAAVYAFWQSPPNPVLWIPTILVCIAGMIKFTERTLALRSGSREYMTNKIMSEIGQENDTKRERTRNSIRQSKREIEENLNWGVRPSRREKESGDICEGYKWFDMFKRLLVDVNFSSNLLMHSQDRFSGCDAKDAINLISIELSFLYDILHTKAIQKHCKLGRVFHCSSLVSIIAALVVFHHLDMQQYASKDITITYILFGAGLALEVIATLLLVSSDWTVVSLRKKGWRIKCIADAITSMVKGITFQKGKSRWSRNIGQYNLIGLCLRDRYTPRTWIMKKLIKIKHKWDNMRETRSIPLAELLENIMFTMVIMRAQNMHIYNVLLKARSYRGSKALELHGQLQTLGWSMKKEFDECIILWHVATDICYYRESFNRESYNRGSYYENIDTERDVSLKTSNYMVYLLTQQQSMMQLGYGMKRFEATCDVVKKIFKGKGKIEDKKAREMLENEIITEVGTCDVEDGLGNSQLNDIRRLAQQLGELDPKIKWKLISETWMEMLGFAAIHCDSYQHAKSLSRGGELLTHLWLLMSQMGMIEEHKRPQFEYELV